MSIVRVFTKDNFANGTTVLVEIALVGGIATK